MSGQAKRRWPRAAAMIGMVGLCAGALGPIALGPAAWGQERGMTPPKETIFARKVLMDSISTNMDELEANADLHVLCLGVRQDRGAQIAQGQTTTGWRDTAIYGR